MKKILFGAYSMELGGIEKSLLTLLNNLSKKYKVTLVLEKKQGNFLDKLDTNVEVVEYTPSENKNIILRKFSNLLNRMKFFIKYRNKYDFSASYATYSKASSFVARVASKNNALWVHADYMELFEKDKVKVKQFYKDISFDKFKKLVFVAQKARDEFIKIFPNLQNKAIFCNNIINNEAIIIESNQNITDIEKSDIYTFINVSRHDEKQKKLTRIIEATRLLNDENLNFRVIFVGDGHDHELYVKMIKEYKLEDRIIILGAKENPYPYIKLSDAFILTSDYEGYPVVFLEALTLNKPIITTDISDVRADIEGQYGVVISKSPLDVYRAMKNFIENNYEIKNSFDVENYNKEVLEKIDRIIMKEMEKKSV